MSVDLVELRLHKKARYASKQAPVRYRTGVAPVEEEYNSEDSEYGIEQEAVPQEPQEERFFNWDVDEQSKGLQEIARQEKEIDSRQTRILQERGRRTEEELAAMSKTDDMDPAAQRRNQAIHAIRARRKADQDGAPAMPYEIEEEPELSAAELQERREALIHQRKSKAHDRVDELEEEWDRVSEDEAEESEESGSEEDEEFAMTKPTFISKTSRATVKEKDEEEERAKIAQEAEEKRLERRKEETKNMVVQTLLSEQEKGKVDSDDELPDDDDDEDEAEEYEGWRVREALRIKQYRDERYKMLKEKEEVERRRAMTDEERRLEDQADEDKIRKANGDPVKWKFLQKYFHKGAFHQETESKGILKEKLYQRDIGHAVGLDKLDKEILPEVMQVKKWGVKGRVKWTHLVNEDTTVKATDSLWTTGTAADAEKGSGHSQRNQAYDAAHFTYAFSDQKKLGSANYGSRRTRELV